MEEPLTLVLRLRPPQHSGSPYWTTSGGNTVLGSNSEQFNADNVYSYPSSNFEIFQSSITKLVENTCEGYNTAILAYGQSGAGKTHTLLGSKNEEGLLTHMVRYLFNEIEQLQKTTGRSFLVQLQVMELYCERVKDLLTDNSSSTEPQIFEQNDIPRVLNVTETSVTSAEQALNLVNLAQSRRVVASTELNDQSSRSHAIIQLTVESSLTVAGKSNLRSRKSVMSIVDLAGSENAAANTGQRMKEGANINKSLFTLTKVINTLTEKNPPAHIPYRDSKLTRLLKPCIGGNSTTLIICCIDPQNKEESSRTLKFSERLKLVKGHVTINEDEEGGQLNKYLDEIERLNKELTDMKQKVKEDEMQEKTKRLGELRAQIIGGSECKQAHIRAPRRQTICAPGMRAFAVPSLFTPPAKRTVPVFQLAKINDESPTRGDRLSNVQVVQSTISPESSSLELRPSTLAADDLAELEELRFRSLQYEMKIEELNTEIKKIKISAADETTQLQSKIKWLGEANLKLKKDWDILTNDSENKISMINADNERLKEKLGGAVERGDQLEIQLITEKLNNEASEAELKKENNNLLERIGFGALSIIEREKLITRIEELSSLIGNYKADLDTHKVLLEEKEEIENALRETIRKLNYDLKESVALNDIEQKDISSKLHIAEEKLLRIQNDAKTKQSQLEEEIEVLKKQSALSEDKLYLEKEEELQQSKNEVQRLQKNLDDALTASEAIRSKLYTEITEAVSAKMTSDKENICQLEVELSRLRQVNKKMQLEHDEHNELELRCKNTENKLKDALESISYKDTLLAQMKDQNEQMFRKDEEIRNLTSALSRSKNALSTKTSALEHSTRKNQDAIFEIRELTKKSNTLEQELAEVKNTNRTQDEVFQNKLAFLEKENQRNRISFQNRIADLERKITNLESLNRDKSMENVRLQGITASLRRELEQARATMKDVDLIIESKTNSLIEENRKLQDSLNCAENQIVDADNAIKRKETELENTKMIMEKAVQEANLLKNTTQSDSTFKFQVERLKTENARLKKELVDIEDERLINKENIIKNGQLSDVSNEIKIKELKEQLDKKNYENIIKSDQLSDVYGQMKIKEKEINELTEKLDKKNYTLEEGIKKYNALVKEHNALCTKYANIKEKYLSLKS